MLGFTQPGSSTVVPDTGASLDDLFNLPWTPPRGAANPMTWPWLTATSSAPTAQPAGGVTAWLQGNATAVMVVAGALFALALFGGKRR